VNVGIVGAGFFGEMHAEAIREVPGLRLRAASRQNKDALETFCRRFGATPYVDYRDLYDDPEVDMVVIATPHQTHADMATRGFQAGKHVLLEKPMALSLRECDRIIAAARKSRRKLMIGHVNRFARAYRLAKSILDSGEVGAVVFGVSSMSKLWMEPNRRSWHLDRATGGGMWLTAGMHCLDRLMWLTGSSVSSVSARFDTRFHDQQADDVGLVFVRFRNGSFGSVVSTGYRDGAPKHLTELTCTGGALNIEYTAGVTVGKGEKWTPIPDSGSATWMHEALVEEWRGFLRAIEEDTEEPVPGWFARHVMEVVFAAERSSELGREIAIQGPGDETSGTKRGDHV
jgi:phthalate 4,5-cis-dihydrodiol dehydrogenase